MLALLLLVADVSVEDQFRRPQNVTQLLTQKLLVVVGGDERKTGEATRDWVARLPGTPVYGYADLSGVPFFVPNQSVRNKVKELMPNTIVLCDFDAKAKQLLAFPPGLISVQVYREGKVSFTLRGAVTDERLALLREHLAH